jgi:Spy/CpxP family protein refolding chaperone
MKRRTILLAICVGVTLLVMLAMQHSTQAERQARPGGGPGQPPAGRFMMMQTLPLESSWAHISFELGVADEVLPKVRKIYQEVWNGRKGLMDKIDEARGDTDKMRALRSDADKLRSDLDKKLKDVLSTEQLESLAKWEEETRARARQRPGGGQQPGRQR